MATYTADSGITDQGNVQIAGSVQHIIKNDIDGNYGNIYFPPGTYHFNTAMTGDDNSVPSKVSLQLDNGAQIDGSGDQEPFSRWSLENFCW